MKKIFGWGFLFLFLFFCRFGYSAYFHPFHGWRTIDTKHFSLHYHHSIEEIAKRAASYFEEVHEKLSSQYRWQPWGQTQVILTDNHDEANGLASTLPYNWILLRIVPPEVESSLNTYDDWLKTLITHEYTHILHLDSHRGFLKVPYLLLGKFVLPTGLTPGWIKEGTATLEETEETQGGRGRAAYTEMVVRTAILNKQFPPIDRAAGVHWKWPAAQTQYIFGVKFMQYLKERFGDEKFYAFHHRTQRSILIGAINAHAKKIFGKNFYTLWQEWQQDLREKYDGWEGALRAEGVSDLGHFLSGKDSFYLPTFSRDGKKLAYVTLSPRKANAIWIKDLETGRVEKLAVQTPTQMSFAPDRKSIVFSALATHKRYYRYYDLYQLSLDKKKLKRLTRGQRARDPDFHPDGKKVLFVGGQAGTDQLKLYDLESKEITTLLGDVAPFTQFAQPRYAPDGSQFALVRFLNSKGWELCIYGADGSFKKSLTVNGLFVESRLIWSRDGRSIIFVSDQDGVSNLYAADWDSGKTRRLTRVTTGVFQPTISPEGELLARYYHGEGYDIRKVPFEKQEAGSKKQEARSKKQEKQEEFETKESVQHAVRRTHYESRSTIHDPRKYSPFRQSLFLPRYVSPGFLALDNGLLVSAATGGNDPLRYHNWIGGATYRTDAKHLGYFARYYYNRWKPIFGIGLDDFAVDFGTLSFRHTSGAVNTYHFYEERRAASAFFSIPLGLRHAFGASYFYEDRMPITNILASEAAALNLGIFAGVNMTYVYGERTAYPASISPTEKGRTLKLVGTITNERLGGNAINEQQIFSGDYREYIAVGKNHVLALRIAGGMALGDPITPGTFSLGGSLGEGTLAGGGSSRYFSLRGLPISFLTRDRAMLMSAEYRLPLASPQRGLGTWPIFLNNLHLGFFADYGDAWDRGDVTSRRNVEDLFDDFLLGLGLEARADFVIGHGLPVTGRLGYGVVVVNRNRLGLREDPFLGNLIKNGMLILQWGTSF